MAVSKAKTKAQKPSPSFEWTVGIPPEKTMVAIAVRKWSGMHEGKYIEVLAGSPKRYLEALGLDAILEPSTTVIYGQVLVQGEMEIIIDERGSPVAAYPNSVLGWSYVPEFHENMKLATMTDLAIDAVRRRSRTAPKG